MYNSPTQESCIFNTVVQYLKYTQNSLYNSDEINSTECLPRQWLPCTATVNSASSLPTELVAVTLYWPALEAFTFFTVRRENVPSPSTVTSRLLVMSVSPWYQAMSGVGLPWTFARSMREDPPFSFCGCFRALSYSSTGAPRNGEVRYSCT